jgi:hypothetical protein
MVGLPGAGKLDLESLGFMALVPFASSRCRDFVNLLTPFIGVRTTSVRSSTHRHSTPKYHKVNIVGQDDAVCNLKSSILHDL